MFITFLFPFLSHTEVSYGGTQFHIFKIQMLIIKFGIHYNVDGGKMLIFSIFLCSQNLKKSVFLIKFFFFFAFAAMEIESIEKLLQSLELESYINLFKQNELGLKLLMSLSDTELKEALTELKLPLGNRLLIIKKIQEIKAGGKFTLFRNC